MPSTLATPMKNSASPITPPTVAAPAAESRATKIINLTKAQAHSPFVKSSSIAGLAPLMKRSSGLSHQMKSVSGTAHNHEVNSTFSMTADALTDFTFLLHSSPSSRSLVWAALHCLLRNKTNLLEYSGLIILNVI